MTTGQRIKTRRKEIGMSAERLAELLNISPATIYRYENGDIDKVPGDRLMPIAEALRTTPAALMGWESNSLYSVANVEPMPQTKSVPLLGTIACGTPILADENIEEMVDAPEFVHADFALRCRGDSMINARIFDGDLVYIRRQREVVNGEIAAVRIGDEATLKKVYYNGKRLTLRAANPLFGDIEYEGTELDDVEILGKAVAFTSAIR